MDIRIFLSLILVFLSVKAEKEGVVKISTGSLQGYHKVSAGGRDFWSFSGIPYGKPPVGELRFKAPEPAEPWEGVRDATKEGSVCMQLDIFRKLKFFGDEDCLFLNVYTPQFVKDVDSSMPVMVYIHGGAFMSGSGNAEWFGPLYLMDRDIVLVTINYRLGALGFLSTGDEASPGNNGLRDQNLALKWVQQNIASFGGDPNKVTLFGESAGGASVHYHILSPLSKGLFHNAIMQSGTAYCPWAYADTPRAYASKLGLLLNCPINSTYALVDCLKQLPAQDIVTSFLKFLKYSIAPVTPFGPTKELGGSNKFLEDEPYELVKSGNYNHVPIVTGVTTHEGGVWTIGLVDDKKVFSRLQNHFLKEAPAALDFEKTALDSDDVAKKVRDFYFPNDIEIMIDDVNLVNLFSDRYHFVCNIQTARDHAESSNKDVFFYVFGYKGRFSSTQFLGNVHADLGVSHLDELLYLFDGQLGPVFKKGDPEKAISEQMTKLWTTFARHGDPTPDISGVLVKWLPMEKNARFPLYLRIDQELGLQWDFPYNRINFWEGLMLREPPYHDAKGQNPKNRL